MDRYKVSVGVILFLVGLLLIHYLRLVNLSFMSLIILLLFFSSALVFLKKLRKLILDKLSLFMKGKSLLDEVLDIEKSNGYLTSQRFHKLMKQFDEYSTIFRELTKLRIFLKKGEFSQAEKLYSLMNEKREVIKNYNENFIRERLKTHKSFFDGKDDGLERSLDKQQRLAIVKDDKHNLVIAGAGSGKTAVLTARIVYLLRRKDRIASERILALAFNRKAAKEVDKRLKSDYNVDSVEVRTFHSFGLSIINENLAERPIVLTKNKSEKRIRDIFLKLRKNKRLKNLLSEYFSRYLDEELDEASFSEKEEYYHYMRNKQYTTLSVERVKSFSERDIANFLFRNNVKFVYEDVARWADTGDSYGPYRPDFYLPDYGLYIEHWGVDEKGNIPPWFEMSKKRYHEKMKWAREQFSNHEKVLIETFEYQKRGGQLETILKEKLMEKNVSMKELTYEELVERVYGFKETCDKVSEMFSTFINLAKSNHISPDKLRSRISKLPDTQRKVFAKMGLSIYKAYQKSLKKNNEIDFEDMINRAIKLAKKKREKYKNRYDHVLVDEFQDVSNQKVELIKALVGDDSDTKLFCVGDDWQSIYAFAGSEVRFFIEFEDCF
ncbi:MAG: UvrD-helicase domain-containing protein, partial [Candidatus Altiarchaeota archaeon]|nr:UvrD-helicase domain-containing protein [Candidatus Altiarchaeota archaeon]